MLLKCWQRKSKKVFIRCIYIIYTQNLPLHVHYTCDLLVVIIWLGVQKKKEKVLLLGVNGRLDNINTRNGYFVVSKKSKVGGVYRRLIVSQGCDTILNHFPPLFD